jgi:hypothetical protein
MQAKFWHNAMELTWDEDEGSQSSWWHGIISAIYTLFAEELLL